MTECTSTRYMSSMALHSFENSTIVRYMDRLLKLIVLAFAANSLKRHYLWIWAWGRNGADGEIWDWRCSAAVPVITTPQSRRCSSIQPVKPFASALFFVPSQGVVVVQDIECFSPTHLVYFSCSGPVPTKPATSLIAEYYNLNNDLDKILFLQGNRNISFGFK